MAAKRPSSIDYSAHLHELALSNWRRAVLARDPERAVLNAEALTASHDKFWRFLGELHLGLARLCGGRAASALEAFSKSAHVYPDARELVSLPLALSAHTYLELGSPDEALTILDAALPTPETKYWRALALVRLSERERAQTIGETIGVPALAEHVAFEVSGDMSILRRAASRIAPDALDSPQPWVPIFYAMGLAHLDCDEVAEAARIFAEVRNCVSAALHWPIPYIRALKHLGDLSSQDQQLELAHQAYSELLEFWRDGEMDRAAIASASQFVKS